jgi:hypothetical protein
MVGTHINRNITWAEQAEPFMKYLARNSYMLQQGKFIADLAYLLDEGAPSTMPIWGSGLNPAPPEGYDYDYINADVLINRMTVSSDGRLVLPDGMSYAILVLPNSDLMTLPVLRKIKELVKAGATVMGPRPESTPGYSGYPGSEEIFKALVSELWADLDGVSRTTRVFGKGKILWGTPVKTVLDKLGIIPDVEYSKPLDSRIDWIHRRAGDTDIYFLVNSTDNPLDTEVRFRVTGKEAELWDPVTGTIIPSGYAIKENRTVVPVNFTERQSLFIVLRNKTDLMTRSFAQTTSELLVSLTGPWEVSFPSGMGAPEKLTLNSLESWTASKDEGVKYFSGTAMYTKTFEVPKSRIQPDAKLMLDLGKVADIAEVTINGIWTGLLWNAPYRTDITGLLKKGMNKIEIKITNQWTNRLIGDQKSTPDKKILNSSVMVWGRNLNESGLLGPVKIYKYYDYEETF